MLFITWEQPWNRFLTPECSASTQVAHLWCCCTKASLCFQWEYMYISKRVRFCLKLPVLHQSAKQMPPALANHYFKTNEKAQSETVNICHFCLSGSTLSSVMPLHVLRLIYYGTTFIYLLFFGQRERVCAPAHMPLLVTISGI